MTPTSLERLSMRATARAGSSLALGIAVSVVVAWIVTGPLFDFSDTWPLVINAGTTASLGSTSGTLARERDL